MSEFYIFQIIGMPIMCGDFYVRCGDPEDFVAGIDDIIPRNEIDFKQLPW